ncbi:MAG: hypothetical protein OXR66_06050 [Candidatus Woesearchaeota archaeon]|nr:hypothetical protein [Candidatus Woesearchaeota archaeon]
MRRAEIGPVMYLVLGTFLLLVILLLVVSARDTSFGIIDYIRGIIS